MDVHEKSEWFVISAFWLNKWKDYVNYDDVEESQDTAMQAVHPGMITNEDILDEVSDLLFDFKRRHLNVNLKENLREEDHYYIVDEKLWRFLLARYGGVEIKRYGVKRDDNSGDCTIEVNLLKLSIHYFPGQQDEDVNLYTIFESRFSNVEGLKERLAELKQKNISDVKLWKAPKPSDFDAFYRNNICEFRKHREIRLDAEHLNKKSAKIGEARLSMDDFIIVECRCQGRFIFEEFEKENDGEACLDDNMDLEDSKDEVNDPKTLAFLKLDIGQVLKKNSNAGLSGLSNLGNT
jgi:DUSP domain